MPEALRITADNYVKFVSLALGPGYTDDRFLASQRIHSGNGYTLRQDASNLRADVQFKTASALRTEFPERARFADRLFAKGRAALPLSLKDHPQFVEPCERYPGQRSPRERLTIRQRVLCYLLSRRLRGRQARP